MGAAVNVIANNGHSSLSTVRSMAMAQVLINASAALNAGDNEGATPLVSVAARPSAVDEYALQHAGEEETWGGRNMFYAAAMLRLMGSKGASLSRESHPALAAEMAHMLSARSIVRGFFDLTVPSTVLKTLLCPRVEMAANICDVAFTRVAQMALAVLLCGCMVPAGVVWLVATLVALVCLRCTVRLRYRQSQQSTLFWANECRDSGAEAKRLLDRELEVAGSGQWSDEYYNFSDQSSFFLDPEDALLEDNAVDFSGVMRLSALNTGTGDGQTSLSLSSGKRGIEMVNSLYLLCPFLLVFVTVPFMCLFHGMSTAM